MKCHSHSRCPVNKRLGTKAFTVLVVLLLLASEHVEAKEEKFPTISPSAAPTESPSYSPSTTFAPTNSTTPAPTSSSTESTTLDATGAVVDTRPPATKTVTPTSSPTQKGTYVNHVQLPRIGIDVMVSDGDAASKSVEDLEVAMTDFFENVLDRNSGVDSFDKASFDFDVIESSFNRRRLKTGLSINIEGTAYFESRPPSAQDLSLNIHAYFAVWGIEDLEDYLRLIGLPSANVVAMYIDGETVQHAAGTGYKAGANVEQPASESDSTISAGLIAALAAACTLLVIAVVILIVTYRRRKRLSSGGRSRSRHRKDATPIKQADSSDSEDAAPSPKTSHTPIDDDEHSVGNLSLDMSLYTTDDSIVNPPLPTKPYNTKRLDKVIEMAKKHSDGANRDRLDI